MFNPKLVIESYLKKLLDTCLNKALHIRHGAILGVGEVLIGLAGHSVTNRRENIEKVFSSLSKKERDLIEDSEQKKAF